MRIAYDYQIFGAQKYGGISRYFYELVNNIVNLGAAEVGIISPIYISAYLDAALNHMRVMGVRVPSIRRTGRIFRSINQMLAPSMMERFKPDLVHETYYSISRTAPAKAKVVLTVYDMIHEKFSDHFSIDDSTSRAKAIAVERADHVICISEQTRRDLIDLLGVNPAKTSVVHLGFKLSSQGVSEQKLEMPTRPFLLYVGQRAGYKNFEGLLRAYAASSLLRNDFDLVCFGGGALTDREKNLTQQLELPIGSIRQISGDDALLARYYKSASAFIYPSLYEGFGIPPLEAMSFDCPVICSGVSSMPEVIGDAGEMFDPYEPDSIRMAIEKVIDDNSLQQDLIAHGRERIKLFSWERCAQETMDVYRRVLA